MNNVPTEGELQAYEEGFTLGWHQGQKDIEKELAELQNKLRRVAESVREILNVL